MPKRLLVVGDDYKARSRYRQYLETAGYHVDDAASGSEAAGIIQSGAIVDLLQTDLEAHNGHAMGGLALVRFVRWLHPHLPILAISDPGEAATQNLNVAQPFCLLDKPVNRGTLVDTVDALLLHG